ncbi:hypothetical protein C7M61_004012 [Candidozyma pseudohaemuli]|uniref:Uncharacterized protein n=1 Tax=Candidozyma pseudohaemuli TaxID=418784 RepID=A0A2P7YKP2_9ASCO|nr:hypothetical protein C7M61_004012 [[Candida] pseudohaemulonii]PSK36539.1 hypothetical protein C7M61_004012 [[Candida] pseudohaemulonii]
MTVKTPETGVPDGEVYQYEACMAGCMDLPGRGKDKIALLYVQSDKLYTFGSRYENAKEVLEALGSDITSDIAESDWTDVDLSNGYYPGWDDDEVINNDNATTVQTNSHTVYPTLGPQYYLGYIDGCLR